MKRKHILLILLALPYHVINAQGYESAVRNLPQKTPFEQLQRIVNRYYDSVGQARGTGYKQWKREEWWALRHLSPDGYVEDNVGKNKEALQRLSQTNQLNSPSTHGLWIPMGPTSVSSGNDDVGRVVCIAFHPTNVNTFFVGTPAGGLWRTTNNGASFAPLTDHLPGLGVASIAINPSNPNIMYILTGDGNASHRGHYLKEHGTGVYRSTDGGETWSETAMIWDYSSVTFGYKLMMHPANPNILFAATSTGFWRSFNSGTTWTQELNTEEITDIEFDPNSGARMYACGYSSNFYLSTDTGNTWTTVNIGAAGANRMEISVTPDNTANVYVLAGPDEMVGGSFGYVGLFRSNNNGIAGSWAKLNETPNILGYDNAGNDNVSQTWRNISLYVSPVDDQTMLTGGSFIWKSTNGGSSFSKSSGTIHADNHFIVRSPHNTDLYSGCDGGLYRSIDGGVTWDDLSATLQITQYYRFDMSETNSGYLLAGAQDNSQMLRNGSNAYATVTCCDGMDQVVDYADNNIMYGCIQNGGLSKSTNGSTFDAAITQPTAGDDFWVTNIIQHTTASNTIFFGGSGGIRRSIDGGGAWVNIGSNGQDYIAQGTSNPDRMYAAVGLTIRMSTNVNAAVPTWTILGTTGDYPTGLNMFITGLAVNPDNSLEMWLTCSGYYDGQKVYRTTDAGANWQNMSGTLPNIPIHSIVFEDNNGAPGGAVYIGTEIGVFYRDNTMSDWTSYGNYLPNSPVTDLKIFYGATRYLYASTFGRGMWRTTTRTGCVSSYNISFTLEGYKFIEVADSIISTGTMSGGTGTEIYLKAGNYIQLKPGFLADATDGFFKAWIGPCGTGGLPNPNVVSELNIANAAEYFKPTGIYNKEVKEKTTIVKNSDGTYHINIGLKAASKVHVFFEDETKERIAYVIDDIMKPGNYSFNLGAIHPKRPIKLGVDAGGEVVRVEVK